MTKFEVLDTIANDHLVEKIVYKLIPNSKNRFDCPQDLIQDIYVALLEKPESVIIDLYNKKEIGFFVLRIAENQIFSCNSHYFYKYIKFSNNCDDISEASHIPQED